MYDVSSAAGARLRQNHRLITTGPFAHIRHPMYVGIELASFGALLLYRTWTVVFLLVAFAGLTVRAHREDEILLQEFGDEWRNYAAAVPAWFPRLTSRQQVKRTGSAVTPDIGGRDRPAPANDEKTAQRRPSLWALVDLNH